MNETSLNLYDRTAFKCVEALESLWAKLRGRKADAPSTVVADAPPKPQGEPLDPEELKAYAAIVGARIEQAIGAAKLENESVTAWTTGESSTVIEDFADRRVASDPRLQQMLTDRAVKLLDAQSRRGEPLGVELLIVHVIPPQGDFPPSQLDVLPCPACSPSEFQAWAQREFEEREVRKKECGHADTLAEDHFQLLDSGLYVSPRKTPPARIAWEAKQSRKAGGMRSTKARPPREQ
ncbi:hypothetical protein DB347_20815 [Opitutaceae bacterium EW11]|nr:hypothetical protein DB347_20815 [Opitutaceae bacterium EW11]